MRLLESMIAGQGGEVRFDWRVEGLACDLALPLKISDSRCYSAKTSMA
jgi:hypothetical protein